MTNNFVQSFFHECTWESVQSALEFDIQWLVSVVESTNRDSPESEWSGTMARLAKDMGKVPDSATQFVFGPLIDVPMPIQIQS